jgi:hypothetical protein
MQPSPDYPEVAAWLRQRGDTDDEISKILDRVRQYEQRTLSDSVMDTIGTGQLDIAALVDAALADSEEIA